MNDQVKLLTNDHDLNRMVESKLQNCVTQSFQSWWLQYYVIVWYMCCMMFQNEFRWLSLCRWHKTGKLLLGDCQWFSIVPMWLHVFESHAYNIYKQNLYEKNVFDFSKPCSSTPWFEIMRSLKYKNMSLMPLVAV